MKYALIGCGRIAPNHIAAALDNNLEIIALCDIIPENIDKLMSPLSETQKQCVKKFTDYKQMLKEQVPELVAIATESGKHAQIALDCIESGSNVIIEKPIALSLKDADSIIVAAKARGVKVCACHQNRFNKSVQKIREALEGGRFGKLLHGTAHIRWNRGQDYYTQGPWRGTWEQDGGALMNQCIHNIDLLRWMMGGEIEEVFGYTANLKHDYIEAEDLGIGVIKFKNGSYGILEGTTNIYPKNLEETLYIFGDKGTVKAGGKSVNIIEEWQFADKSDDSEHVKANYHENPPNVYGFGHKPLYADVISAIKDNREPYITAKDGRDALELVLAIYKSSVEGRPVKLPMLDCSTIDFKQKPKFFVHESSYIDKNVRIGDNTKIWHFCHILSNTKIGKDSSFGQNCIVGPNVTIGNNVKVQNNVSIYDGVEIEDDVFCGPSMVFTNVINPRSHVSRKHEYKKTLLKKGCSIGANATIVCGHSIGQYAFVAAGAVVTKDIPDYALVMGNPAKIKGWVCQCGVKLFSSEKLEENKTYKCAECGKEYINTESVIKEI